MTQVGTATASHVRRFVGRPAAAVAPYLVVGAIAVGLAAVAANPDQVRFGFAALATVVFFLLSLRSPRLVLLGTIVWLVALGTTRRLIVGLAADAVNDPLLLIAPAATGALLFAATSVPGTFRLDTPLSKWITALTGLVILGAVNPLQGSFIAGVAGLLFFLVPLLWYWIGRAYLDRRTTGSVLLTLAAAACVAAVYGLFQSLVGFPAWDQRWIDARASRLTSLVVGDDSLRQFGPFTSAQEYAAFVAAGIVLWLAFLLKGRGGPLPLAPIALCAAALALASIRGSAVAAVVAVGLMLAARLRLPLGPTLAVGVAALVGLIAVSGSINTDDIGDDSTRALVARTVEGVSDPLSSESSTLPLHLGLTTGALEQAISRPLGSGLSTASLAGRLGSGNSGENDVARVALALGIPGLVCYVMVIVHALGAMWRRVREQRDVAAFAISGVLVITAAQWLNGALYALSPIVWLLIGALDGPDERDVAIDG